MKRIILILSVAVFFFSCNSKDVDPQPGELQFVSAFIDQNSLAGTIYDVRRTPEVRLTFNNKLNRSSVSGNIILQENGTGNIPVNLSYEKDDSTVVIIPQQPLKFLTLYNIDIEPGLQSADQGALGTDYKFRFVTVLDSSDKFPILSDNDLLDTVQRRTFKYFWDFGHPVSGMARERNSSGDLVTTGGTGFGIMAIVTAVHRNYITRTEGRDRILKIANFLLNNCTRYHGAFAHWINGATGATIPFSPNDNGADLVETSYLVKGLLVAREYFDGGDATETDLRDKINTIWNGVEWNFFRKNNENVLYWHWSPTQNWIMNMQIRGWNEALIVYALAAGSTTDPIPAAVYHEGWARNGAIVNNGIYYGYQLPLGPPNGGPLFISQYSFLGINPNDLSDNYANYETQTRNHTLINYEYCKANPRGFYGYSALCWGLTASDIPGGYAANEPNNDRGVITPTAAISSMPFTPTQSMDALKFFYYKLGDKLWGPYGFYDAFSLKDLWFANSTLAIDQGPIIIMIENYRSGLIWDLFTGAPEVRAGLIKLGFDAPYL